MLKLMCKVLLNDITILIIINKINTNIIFQYINYYF